MTSSGPALGIIMIYNFQPDTKRLLLYSQAQIIIKMQYQPYVSV